MRLYHFSHKNLKKHYSCFLEVSHSHPSYMHVCKGWWLRMENWGNSKAALVGSVGSQQGAWCSASKRGSSPPEPALHRDLAVGLWGIESSAALHLYIMHMDGAQASFEASEVFDSLDLPVEFRNCTRTWPLFSSSPLALILWEWRRKSFLTLHSYCLPSM